jgi:hypothetical protein
MLRVKSEMSGHFIVGYYSRHVIWCWIAYRRAKQCTAERLSKARKDTNSRALSSAHLFNRIVITIIIIIIILT